MTNQVAITMLKNLEQSLDDYCELNDEGKEAFHMAITALELFGNSEQLPSTQTERWDTCFDCPLSHGCPVINGCTNEQAMEYASKIPDDCPISVQPRKGKWIGYNADDKDWQRDDGSPIFMNCSECHEAVINNGSAHWNFCPNCGADMRGDNNEVD